MGLGKRLIMPQDTGVSYAVDDANLKVHYEASNASSYPGSGSTWIDLKGTINASLLNGATFNSAGYVTLDGANDKVSVSDNNLFSMVDSGDLTSISLWFRNTESTSAYRVLFSKGGTNKWEYAMFLFFSGSNRGGNWVGYHNGATNWDTRNYSSSNTWVGTNIWHHIVVTVDRANTTAKWYLDGTQRGSDTSFTYGGTSATDPFIIGGRADLTNNFFQGDVNNFRLYNKILSQSEVTALYNAGYQG